jgi:hypothetical protein
MKDGTKKLADGTYRVVGADGAALRVRVDSSSAPRLVVFVEETAHGRPPLRMTPNRDASVSIYNDAAHTGWLHSADCEACEVAGRGANDD